MFKIDGKFTRTAGVLACGLAACAIAAPGAVAGPVGDDAATPITLEPRTDFRSPDTRDAADGYAPAQEAVQRTDFRSPDTRDAAEGYAPAVVAERASEAGGFDWGTAGITLAGAAGLFIVALAMLGGARLGRGRVARP